MKKISITVLSVLLSLIVSGCGGGSSGSGEQYPRFSSSDNEIVNFTFPVSKNPALTGDVTGLIADPVITLEVPHSTDLTSMIAEYTTNSTHVEVNSNVQSSGITPNNFSNPVEYTVTADNGVKRVYSVVVNKAPSEEKSLTAFSINGIAGEIDESAGTVSVKLPPKTQQGSLKAVFSTAGKSVSAEGAVQESGVTVNDFSRPVKYTVTAEDGSKKEYTVTVEVLKDTAKEILSFGFMKSDNPALSTDVYGSLSGDTINVVLPYGSGKDSLKAFFETSGETVKVNDAVQLSGVTVNNFSLPVGYVVTAENGDVHPYSVEVSVAKSDAKAITECVIDGETAVINEAAKSITVQFPSAKNKSALTAVYVTTGVKVTVGGVEQVNGVTKNDFTSPVIYTVTADNGSAAGYTATAENTEAIAGLWNFEYGTDGSYTVHGAAVTDGILGNALHFNKGDYVLVPDSDYLTLAVEGSIEAVIKADSHQPFAGVVHKGVNKDFSDESYSLQFWGANGTDGTLRFSVFNSAGEYVFVESSTKLETGTWYYVAATWNASEIKLYVNGNPEDTVPNTIGTVRDSSGGLVIGAQLPVIYSNSWSNLVFNGTIDLVQIYSRVLTEQEISDKYNSMPFASSSALTAYILKTAVKNYAIIGGVFGILILVLIGIFIYNRKRAKSLF